MAALHRSLPPSASWIIEGRLAVMEMPCQAEMRALHEAGIELVVNLTSKPGATAMARACGMEGVMLPVEDMTAPTQAQIVQFVRTVAPYVQSNKAVAVHCMGGRGRSGTMAACYLVKTGMDPWEAMREVRRRRPGAIEIPEQETAIVEFADSLDRG